MFNGFVFSVVVLYPDDGSYKFSLFTSIFRAFGHWFWVINAFNSVQSNQFQRVIFCTMEQSTDVVVLVDVAIYCCFSFCSSNFYYLTVFPFISFYSLFIFIFSFISFNAFVLVSYALNLFSFAHRIYRFTFIWILSLKIFYFSFIRLVFVFVIYIQCFTAPEYI